MTRRKIIHIDMGAFYVSIEQRDSPEFRGKPLTVNHVEERGAVTAASYEARRYGVRSAMASQEAKRLYLQLIIVPGRTDVCRSVSHQIHEIFREHTDIIEPLSLDEALLDVTGNKKDTSPAVDVAKEIKQEIQGQFNLAASVGVSYNKFLVKIASDYHKLDGLCTIRPKQALDFAARLPIESFWRVDLVTIKKMHLLDIHNELQLQKCSLGTLTARLGKAGVLHYECSRGIDERPVEAIRIRKSADYERTLERGILAHSLVITGLHHVVVELIERLQRKDFKGSTLTLKIRFHDFSRITRNLTQSQEPITLDWVPPLAKELLKSVEYEQHPIQLIGLSVSDPREEVDEQHGVWEQLSSEFSGWD